jgi:hypothetical protein
MPITKEKKIELEGGGGRGFPQLEVTLEKSAQVFLSILFCFA